MHMITWRYYPNVWIVILHLQRGHSLLVGSSAQTQLVGEQRCLCFHRLDETSEHGRVWPESWGHSLCQGQGTVANGRGSAGRRAEATGSSQWGVLECLRGRASWFVCQVCHRREGASGVQEMMLWVTSPGGCRWRWSRRLKSPEAEVPEGWSPRRRRARAGCTQIHVPFLTVFRDLIRNSKSFILVLFFLTYR